MKFTKFGDIPEFTQKANYTIHMDWKFLQGWLDGIPEMNLDPDFQRAHVWNDEQRIRFVEYALQGGMSGREIYFNHPGWQNDYKGEMVLVDGKQRLNAVLKFLNNELPAFGTLYKDYEDRLRMARGAWFLIAVNTLKTRAEVLQWYIDLNDGGIAHTSEEIQKVKDLLDKER